MFVGYFIFDNQFHKENYISVKYAEKPPKG